jgi:hypothetical protein
MLIHQQNSCAPRGKQRTSRREAQSCEQVNKVKKLSVLQLGRPRSPHSKTVQFFVIILLYYLATLLLVYYGLVTDSVVIYPTQKGKQLM